VDQILSILAPAHQVSLPLCESCRSCFWLDLLHMHVVLEHAKATAPVCLSLLQDPMHGSEAAHAEAQARLLLRPPSPAQSSNGAGLLGVLDFRSSAGSGAAVPCGSRRLVYEAAHFWDPWMLRMGPSVYIKAYQDDRPS
jgi:hypothetical protein